MEKEGESTGVSGPHLPSLSIRRMRMWLSYEKPGEEGYILKNNKNKVDRIERTSCNNKCGGEG